MPVENPVFMAFGANLPLGNMMPRQTVEAALAALAGVGLPPVVVSRFFATPCFPAGAGPDYVNGVAVLEGGAHGPAEVLALLHAVEAEFGRERLHRWAGRTLDLDLLAMGAQVLPDADELRRWQDLPAAEQAKQAPDQLILPHPRLQDRAFVLVPLLDVAPNWRHPLSGRNVAEMLAALPAAEVAEVKPL